VLFGFEIHIFADSFIQFTQYFAFCAVVILYVYTIQQSHATDDKYRVYFNAAAKCQGQISALADSGSLAQRYSLVLEELRLEAIKQIQQQLEPQDRSAMNSTLRTNFSDTQLDIQHGQDAIDVPVDMFQMSGSAMFHSGPNETAPSSLRAELTSWGEFDSLVSLPNLHPSAY
jgi:hypothetical protein